MTDSQFGLLIAAVTAGLGGIAAVIRWSVGVIQTALLDNTKAMISNTASNAVLATKIDTIAGWVDGVRTTPATQPTPPPGTLRLPTNG